MKLCLTALYIFYIIFLAYIQHNGDVSLEKTKTVDWHCSVCVCVCIYMKNGRTRYDIR
jgi:hypothetical protein